jgi:hypothetical protein
MIFIQSALEIAEKGDDSKIIITVWGENEKRKVKNRVW